MSSPSDPSTHTLRGSSIRYAGWLILAVYILPTGIGIYFQIVAGTSTIRTDSLPVANLLNAVVYFVWVIVGAILISKQPRNIFGWLFAVHPLLFALDQFSFGYAYYGTILEPGSLPMTNLMIIWGYWSGRNVSAFSLSLLFALFPTGRPLSKAWGRLLWAGGSAVLLFIVSSAFAPLPTIVGSYPFPTDLLALSGGFNRLMGVVATLSFVALILSTFISVGAPLIRLARGRYMERQQLKWFVYAAVFFIPGVVFLTITQVVPQNLTDLMQSLGILFLLLTFTGIPVASAIAILRYQLFDIDIIIRRTLSYAVLSVILAGIYFGGVIGFQTIFRSFIGNPNSPLITVISTLTIAALFNPLRTRIQAFIDRRFYRAKYDAERALGAFSAAARSEVDLDRLAGAMLEIIENTLRPESTSIWVRRKTE